MTNAIIVLANINASLLVCQEAMSLTDDYNIPWKQSLVTLKSILSIWTCVYHLKRLEWILWAESRKIQTCMNTKLVKADKPIFAEYLQNKNPFRKVGFLMHFF